MPLLNFHKCRLIDPGKFESGSFRTIKRKHDDKEYNVTVGKLKGETSMTEQSFRYPTNTWTEKSARSHCEDHDGIKFSPAVESDTMSMDSDPLPKDYEFRMCAASELRVDHDGEFSITGYAAVFDTFSEEMFGFKETIDTGAFKGSIRHDDIRALMNHDPNIVLGRNKAKTLRMEEDAHGLRVDINTPDTQAAKDMMTLIERGDVTQMSFGFTIQKEHIEHGKDDEDITIRRLQRVKLWDVSVVTFPAYPDTEIALRSVEAWRHEMAEAATKMNQAAAAIRRRRLDLAELE